MPVDDLNQIFGDKLREAGLAVDHVETDGLLHRCGTSARPGGKDGAYIAHADSPASVWWQNWQTGEDGTYCPVKKNTMTAAERDILKKRIAEARARREAEEERRHAKAAETAATRWNEANDAPDTHPYLERKGVRSYGLRLWGNQLLVPLHDEAGKLVSLQSIDPDGEKRFLAGGKTRGGAFFIPARDGKTATVLIAEGYATAASACMASGYAAFVAFNAGNLLSVAMRARRLFPESKLIVVADDDWQTEEKTGKNTGLKAAEEAARRVGGWLAVPSVRDTPGASDINDLHKKGGIDAVWRCLASARYADGGLEEATPAPESGTPSTSGVSGRDAPSSTMPEGYFLIADGPRAGLYCVERRRGEEQEVRLGPPLFVRGMTRDADSNEWGLWLVWNDPDGKLHQWAMPLELLSRYNSDWHAMLVRGGWLGDPRHKSKVAAFLSMVRPKERVRCVPCVGWHKDAFVLPDVAYGAVGESMVLQSANHARLYDTDGTAESWRAFAGLAEGNSRLALAVSAALAGPLLYPAGIESGGFNFVGGSSTGKTTALRFASSVWGGKEHIRSWRTTDNALESLAAHHNDTTLILDELGQASARAVSEAAYMLTNGQGKARAGKDGSARTPQQWRLLFLSSGEVGLSDKLAEIGQRPKAGQEVRLVDIPADAGRDMGIFEELHGFPDAGALSLHIREESERCHGHAGRLFLERLAEHREAVRDRLRELLPPFVSRICPANADGQVKRVALRFAVCAAAESLAEDWGIVPWKPGTAFDAAEQCFAVWLRNRGGAGASEDAAVESTTRLFMEQHGASRFQDMDNPAITCINRVGFRRNIEDGRTEYLVLPEAFKAEVIAGHNPTRAVRVLSAAGWLVRDSERDATVKRNLPGMGRVRCYAIRLPVEVDDDA